MSRSFACDKADFMVINMCSQFLGVSRIAGEYVAVLSHKGTQQTYHVPLSSISKEELQRLCNG